MRGAIFLLCGLVLGAVGAAAGIFYLQQRNQAVLDDQIVLAQKNFYDSGDDSAYPMIVMSGTLTAADDVPPGERLAYPNNTHAISCEKVEGWCSVSSIEQIGPKQMGRMDGPWPYQIQKWNAYQIVAGDDESGGPSCFKVTITIERKLQKLLWVQEPINQATPLCEHADSIVSKYTIEDSPGWRKLKERLAPK
jgi:hypothetical protein